MRDLLVRMKPHEAVTYLRYAPQKSAQLYYKAIQSAIANATLALKVTADMLQFKLLIVEEGNTLKRFHAGSKGMAKPIVRRLSHIKIVLTAQEVKPTPQQKEPKVTQTKLESKKAVPAPSKKPSGVQKKARITKTAAKS